MSLCGCLCFPISAVYFVLCYYFHLIFIATSSLFSTTKQTSVYTTSLSTGGHCRCNRNSEKNETPPPTPPHCLLCAHPPPRSHSPSHILLLAAGYFVLSSVAGIVRSPENQCTIHTPCCLFGTGILAQGMLLNSEPNAVWPVDVLNTKVGRCQQFPLMFCFI